VEVVPVSVLLETISAAAAECGASALFAIRFKHPIVVDQPRVIQVVADEQSVIVSSRPTTDIPPHRWVKHVSGRLAPLPCSPGAPKPNVWVGDNGQYDLTGGETRSVAELLQAWGIEG
jgi:phthiocerol/phenolphthiocerol synthesis type-I polyketide synthase A